MALIVRIILVVADSTFQSPFVRGAEADPLAWV